MSEAEGSSRSPATTGLVLPPMDTAPSETVYSSGAEPPPPPPIMCCGHPACGAAEAVRAAVAAAFLELQPALLEAVSSSIAHLGKDKERRRDRKQTGNKMAASDPFGMTKALSRRSSGSELDHSEVSVAPVLSSINTPLGLGSEKTEASGASMVSRVRMSMSRQTSGMGRSSYTPPTVQSLQTDIANSVLEQGGFGVFGRGTSQSFSSSIMRSADPDVLLGKPARVVPEYDERPSAHSHTVRSEGTGNIFRDPFHNDRQSKPLPVVSADAGRNASGSLGESEHGVQNMSSSRSSISRAGVFPALTSGDVLRARCNQLAREATLGSLPSLDGSDDDATLQHSVPRLLRAVPTALLVFGLLPWDTARRPCFSLSFQWGARLLVALSAVAFILLGLGQFAEEGCSAGTEVCWQRNGFLSQAPLPVGAICVLLLVSLRGQQRALEDTFTLLRGLALERRYQLWRGRQACRDMAVFVLLWLCTIAASCAPDSIALASDMERAAKTGVLSALLMAVLAGTVLCLAYGMVHVCRWLSIMIDAFCCDVVQQESPERVAHIWNMTQAILRKASVAVEHCLLMLCFILLFTVPLLLFDVGVLHAYSTSVPTMIPALCVTCGILYVLLLAARISEQCTRVPALVNAISFGEGTEAARQQTVAYISSSAAGFYVYGMRLTTATVLKFMYVWIIVVVGLLTRVGSD